MKLRNNINKAIKEALSEHSVPLREPQWDRIAADLQAPKKKKPFVFWTLLLLCLVLISGICAFFINKRAGLDQAELVSQTEVTHSPRLVDEQKLEQAKSELSEAQKTKDLEQVQPLAASQRPPSKTDGNRNRVARNGKVKNSQSTDLSFTQKKADEDLKQAPVNLGEKMNTKPNLMDLPSTANQASGNIDDQRFKLIEPNLELGNLNFQWPLTLFSEAPWQIEFIEKVSQPEVKTPETLRPKTNVKVAKPRFAIGLSSGYSSVSTHIESISNEQKLHKDTRKIFEQTNSNQQSSFFNLSFDYLLFSKIGIGFSTGIQYMNIASNIQMDYRLNQIPFRMPNGDILTYITLADSLSPVIKVNNETALRYINIPVKIAYAFYIKGIHEIQLSAGTNLSLLAGSKGNTFSLNEAKTQPVGNMISNIFNAGYTGGIQYSRPIIKHWHLGCGMLIQRNRQDYNMDYGILKSKLALNNLNLTLKYKF